MSSTIFHYPTVRHVLSNQLFLCMITHHVHSQAHMHCLLTTHLKEEAPTNVANQSIACAQMHHLLTPHLIKQTHTKPCILVVRQDPTLRIRCPFTHCTLLYLAKPANDVCRSLPASQMDRCPNQMCNKWRCTHTSLEAAN